MCHLGFHRALGSHRALPTHLFPGLGQWFSPVSVEGTGPFCPWDADIIVIPVLQKSRLSPMELGARLPVEQGCLMAPSAPGHCPVGGEQAERHQPLPCTGAGCGEVRVCPALQDHPDARLRQPPAGPVVPAAAAEQAGGEWALLGGREGSVPAASFLHSSPAWWAPVSERDTQGSRVLESGRNSAAPDESRAFGPRRSCRSLHGPWQFVKITFVSQLRLVRRGLVSGQCVWSERGRPRTGDWMQCSPGTVFRA